MRDDLSPAQKRQLAWGRRAFTRDVGLIFTDLVKAGEDPTDWADESKRRGREKVDEAESKKKAA